MTDYMSPGMTPVQNQPLAGRDGMNAAFESTDKGGMRGIALLAMAIAEYELKQKAINLAKDYYNVNKQDYDYVASHHQPAMRQTAIEAFGPSNPYYAYDLPASVAAGMAKSNIIDKQWHEARRRMSKYNVGQMRRLDYEMAIAKTHAVMGGWNAGIRYELAWADEHNNRTYNRKLSIANIGIGFGNIVRAGLAASVQKLAASYDNIGDTIASIGNGMQERAGYQEARKDIRKLFNPAKVSQTSQPNKLVQNERTPI
jgi:hypothetical protein